MIIFAPEEAEIFKDYLFILARFSAILPLFSYDLKIFFCFLTSNLLYILTKIKSENSTFVFKSPENKNHADKIYYQINKWNSKNFACIEINVITICPEIALKYYFLKMWFYMKNIVNNRRWRILMSMYCIYIWPRTLPAWC